MNIEPIRAIRDCVNILPQSLSGYTCVENKLQYPPIKFYTGGFCYSVMLRNQNNHTLCFRIWLDNEICAKNKEHVLRVSNYLKYNKLTYTIPYSYYESALRIPKHNITIPAVVMEWVDGITLIEYIKQNYRNSALVQKLARNFYAMIEDMRRRGIAHGDLSGDNIMVRGDGSLCLIDYDSFYVAEWGNIKQPLSGIKCYQHPGRKYNAYLNKSIDNFSAQVIYLSLLVISSKSNLFNPNIDKGSGLLFQEQDIDSASSLERSQIYREVLNINNSEIQFRAKVLLKSLKYRFEDVESICDCETVEKEKIIFIPIFKANYCGECGNKFASEEELYCPECGKKRMSL